MSKESNSWDIGSDLCKLAGLLQKKGICSDVGPLQKAGSSCLSKGTDTAWKYTLDKMVFNADEVGGRLAADSTDLTVSLSLDIAGNTKNDDNVSNPLNELVLNIEINGVRPNDKINDIEIVYAAWHLDRHIFTEKDGKNKYSHPLYHFTFGGTKMEAKGHDIYGCAVIMPTPRFAYPPMDGVLGVDFILQNYIQRETICSLVEDPEYVEILRKSQARIWKPFFCSIYSHWNQDLYSVDLDFTPKRLFPLYY